MQGLTVSIFDAVISVETFLSGCSVALSLYWDIGESIEKKQESLG